MREFKVELIPILMGKVEKEFRSKLNDELKDSPAKGKDVVYLLILSQYEGCTLKDLTELSSFDKAYTTNAIKKLGELGFVFCDKKNADSRKFSIYLTDEGKAYVKFVNEKANKIRKDIFSFLTDAEIDSMNHIAMKIGDYFWRK
ncbi:MarR family winged helix-turn-helix transcriptional regulator [Anaerorhabdus furcosa]|uniref:DNA-binding transcriptional regulator, MarR family n=1 Tax=Anaerorhabdus furcosa TaxID=118967 RepID=A0A1T4PGZ6_9FIRM|nr:MarR family transcriptional regulator [Anaerorhabdus furcosa]SJZ90779.1 DNA-binding transcriptional regulator, MarR family [Anaerorhabdus furcosa]